MGRSPALRKIPIMLDTTSPQAEKLMDDLRQVIADTEALLRMSAAEVSDSATEVRDRIERRLEAARVQLAELQEIAVARAKAAGQAADAFVHENPWKSIGLAAAIGLVVGLLVARR